MELNLIDLNVKQIELISNSLVLILYKHGAVYLQHENCAIQLIQGRQMYGTMQRCTYEYFASRVGSCLNSPSGSSFYYWLVGSKLYFLDYFSENILCKFYDLDQKKINTQFTSCDHAGIIVTSIEQFIICNNKIFVGVMAKLAPKTSVQRCILTYDFNTQKLDCEGGKLYHNKRYVVSQYNTKLCNVYDIILDSRVDYTLGETGANNLQCVEKHQNNCNSVGMGNELCDFVLFLDNNKAIYLTDKTI